VGFPTDCDSSLRERACVRRGECAALLAPVANAGLRLLAAPTYIVDGNLSVKLTRGKAKCFVWKKKEIEATAERLNELTIFRQDLTAILEDTAIQ